MLKSLIITAGLLISTASFSSTPETCFGENPDVHATMTVVSINGEMFPVKGRLNRKNFEATLHRCGYINAPAALVNWRKQRRQVNKTAIWGYFIGYPLVATPFHASAAGKWKRLMVEAIENGK